jgi:surface carbohydrate biosynthesis protein
MSDPARTTASRVAIVVDHPQRDLPGIVLTALDLARRGVVCHLVPLNLQEREIWALEPDFVLFNFLRRSNEHFARELHAAGIAFGVLDTEGAIWPNPDEYVSLLWKDSALLREVRCVCMWGRQLAEYVLARGIFAAEQVVVTGCPRFDLYSHPWVDLNEDAAEATRRLGRNILINTNFSITNPRFATPAKCVEMHRTVLGYSEDDLGRMVSAERIAIPETVSMAKRLSETYPNVDVVIRPHPFEDPAVYEEAAVSRKNLRVNQSETIQAAIFAACAVIQRSCTTSIEAGLAGVPTFSPQWIPAPLLMPAAEAVSVACATFDELTTQISAILDGSYRVPLATRRSLDHVVRECCFAADGLSHARAGATVHRALGTRRQVDSVRCRQALYRLECESDSHLSRAARRLRYRLALSPDWSFTRMREVTATHWSTSGKYFDATMVQRLLNRACLLGSFSSAGPHRLDINDVIVAGGADRDDLRPEHARYGVTIAPRRGFMESAGMQGRITTPKPIGQVVPH